MRLFVGLLRTSMTLSLVVEDIIVPSMTYNVFGGTLNPALHVEDIKTVFTSVGRILVPR